MAQGKGLPKSRDSFYGYNTKKTGTPAGTRKPQGPGGKVGSQIIETQRPEHQGIKVGKVNK